MALFFNYSYTAIAATTAGLYFGLRTAGNIIKSVVKLIAGKYSSLKQVKKDRSEEHTSELQSQR